MTQQSSPSTKDWNGQISYTRWALHFLYTVVTVGIYGVFIGILVSHSKSLGMDSFRVSCTLSAMPFGFIFAISILPGVLKLSHAKTFIIVGGAHVVAIASMYFVCHESAVMFYGGGFALFIMGACLFLLANRNNMLLTNALYGDTNKAVATIETADNLGWAVGAYVGTLVYHTYGFAFTMLSCAGLSCLVQIILAVMSWTLVDNSNKDTATGDDDEEKMSSKDVYLLHVRKDLIIPFWVIVILSGACMNFMEGHMVDFYRSKYELVIQKGGIILGVSGTFYPIACVIIGKLNEKYPNTEPKFLTFGLFLKAFVLLITGPVFSTNKKILDVAISAIGMCVLNFVSGQIQLSAMCVGKNCLKTSVKPDIAVSTSLNIAKMGFYLGGFIGPIVGGALRERLEYGTVFAIGTPVYVITTLVIFVYFIKNRTFKFACLQKSQYYSPVATTMLPTNNLELGE